jgi:hypothetical protein
MVAKAEKESIVIFPNPGEEKLMGILNEITHVFFHCIKHRPKKNCPD